MKETLSEKVNRLHEEAMDLAEMAFFAKRRGENYNYCKYILRALNLEKAAARLLNNGEDVEPTRTILYQGAAYFALNMGFFIEAEDLVREALDGNPPEDLESELQDLQARIEKEKRISKRVLASASGYLEEENANPPEPAHIRRALDASLAGIKSYYGTDMIDNLLNRIALEVDFESKNLVASDRPQIFEETPPLTNWVKEERRRISWDFWQAYKKLLTHKGYAVSTIGRLDEITNNILNRLGNPVKSGEWDKRGMIVGDVQSGKTGNFIGLINKAADAGFRIIIVLSGLYENLRQQTQYRIDEGFTGRHSSLQKNGVIGVGKFRDSKTMPPVHPITTTDDRGDLRIDSLRNHPLRTNDYYVLVIKKNPTILRNLLRWLYNSSNAEQAGEYKIIKNVPLLVIDDEADYASINIDKDFVSTINSYIRATLTLFEQSAFVGYTATPYANVFITDINKTAESHVGFDGMKFLIGKELFPRDFIINIPPPSNYIGYTKVFDTWVKSEEERNSAFRPLCIIDDVEEYIPSGHKQQSEMPSDLPPSMKKAIHCFLLVCAARRARGQEKEHNSMLIHVSWYVTWINCISDLVEEYMDEIKNIIRYDEEGFFVDGLGDLWDTEFRAVSEEIAPDLEYTDPVIISHSWDEIKPYLSDAVEKIIVTAVHGKKRQDGKNVNRLNYMDYSDGLSVIVVGGNKLSRGLTLEGLSTSYFLRATRFYDTLLQMGRWFGYRPGYADLCRLFTTEQIIYWYECIGNATQDLKEQFDIMNLADRTPEKYGLAVKKSPGTTLMVSSAIKTRSAKDLTISFSGQLLETWVLPKDKAILENNLNAARLFIQDLGGVSGKKRQGQEYIWENVSYQHVGHFIQRHRAWQPNVNSTYLLLYFSAKLREENLTSWTVVLINNSQDSKPFPLDTGVVKTVGLTRREEQEFPDENGEKVKDPVNYRIRQSHIISPPHEYLDMDPETDSRYQEAFQEWEVEAASGEKKFSETKVKRKYIPGKYIRKYRGEKNALLLIYLLDPTGFGKARSDTPAVGYAISLPSVKEERGVELLANEQYVNEMLSVFSVPEDAEEDPNEDIE